MPTQGWGIVHRMNDTIVQTIGAKSVGANSSAWSSRRSLIRVEREGDIVKAYASQWGTGNNPLTIDPASEITIDLSDPALNLSVFQGEQSYGYGAISQVGASFAEIVFTAPNIQSDPEYIYDLANNQIYQKNSGGIGYVLVGSGALQSIGFPKRVKNFETQRQFQINSATSFTEL